jgi:N-acetyl sugar amidotransferase
MTAEARLSVHVYPTSMHHESRLLRITQTMIDRQIASRILVVGIAMDGFPADEDIDDRRHIHRLSLRFPPATRFSGKVLRSVEWNVRVFRSLRHEPVSIVNCHSLSALPVAAAVSAYHGATLIYEPHELATRTATYNGVRVRLGALVEGILIRRAARTIVVSPSIAEQYRRDYGLDDVTVVMNAPALGSPEAPRRERVLRDRFGIPDGHLVFMYQGLLEERRGVRWLLDAFRHVPPDRHIVFMGFGAMESAIKGAEADATNIHFHSAVPDGDLPYYTAGADVGFALLADDCLNHRFALPNKFFQYLHAGLPVIASDLPEMGAIIDKFGCGWRVPPSADAISECLLTIDDRAIAERRAGVLLARNELQWDREADKLAAVYKDLPIAPRRKRQNAAPSEPTAFRRCTRCVMDTSVSDITFDPQGRCNYCEAALRRLKSDRYLSTEHPGRLDAIISSVKRAGAGRPYDCVIGLSGGVDSSYVAYLLKQFGLRPLAVHFDNGWDSELAVENIERLLKKLDIDLETYVVDWNEFRDLQLAFLKSSLTNTEIPTDHAILAVLYKTAVRHGIQHIIHGGNLATEVIMPASWMEDAKDLRLIRGIHRRFGTQPLKTFPSMGLTTLAVNTFIRRIRYIGILNYVEYSRAAATDLLKREIGWREYGSKHFESIFTRFFQGYLLPRKFRIDKRLAHLSSLILSNQITRDEALEQLTATPYSEELATRDVEYIRQKFRLTEAQFQEILDMPGLRHDAYPNSAWLVGLLAPFVRRAKDVASARTRSEP